jgi:myo-inositol-1(or 4)-monophosphatase
MADKSIEELFAGYCDHSEENVYLIGEETIASHDEAYIQSAINSDCCWVLDPIDGTAPYSVHLPIWGISLGLMSNGKLIEGAVYLPVPDVLLITDREKLLQRSLRKDSDFEIFIPQASPLGLSGHISVGQLAARNWRFDGKNQIFSWSSCVGSFYWLLTGRLSAYYGNFKLWDMAGLLPIMQRADFPVMSIEPPHPIIMDHAVSEMFDLSNTPNRWRIKAPVAAAPDKESALTLLARFRQN